MALSTLSDFQTMLYKVLHSVENSVGLDVEQLVRHEGVSQADVNTLKTNYSTWKASNVGSRINDTHTATSH